MHVLAVVFDSGSLCYNVVADVALRMLESLNAGGPYLYYLSSLQAILYLAPEYYAAKRRSVR